MGYGIKQGLYSHPIPKKKQGLAGGVGDGNGENAV